MEVEELKQVVDANAAEMRAGFAGVKEQFARVDERFAEMREEMAELRQELKTESAETRRYIGVVAEELISNFAAVVDDLERRVDQKIDQKIAASEARLTRKFSKR